MLKYSLYKTIEGEVGGEESKRDQQVEAKERRIGSENREHNGTAAKLTKEGDLCSFKVYIEEKATLEWQVMFTVVKNIEALQQVIISNCLFIKYYYYFST